MSLAGDRRASAVDWLLLRGSPIVGRNLRGLEVWVDSLLERVDDVIVEDIVVGFLLLLVRVLLFIYVRIKPFTVC